MTKFAYISLLFFLLSCAHQDKNSASVTKEFASDDLESLLTVEELKIHHCLKIAANDHEKIKGCVAGTSYEQNLSRSPASEIINQNAWFFESRAKITQFFTLVNKIAIAHSKLRSTLTNKIVMNRGVGFQGDAFLGVGASWLAELANINNRYALYCSPSIEIKTDIGAEVSAYVTQTLSCRDHNEYAGTSISVNGGISGELVGLPFGLNFSYAFGTKVDLFLKKLKLLRKSGQINFTTLAKENTSITSSEILEHFGAKGKDAIGVMYFALQVARIGNPLLKSFEMKGKAAFIKRIMREQKSLGALMKDLYRSPAMNSFLNLRNLAHTKAFLQLLGDFLTGCDFVSGAGSFGISLSPVNVGISYINYVKLLETSPEVMKTFSVVTPFNLLNPMFFEPIDLRAVTAIARDVLSIPTKVQTSCKDLGFRLK